MTDTPAEPSTIAQLFATDPLKLSEQDITTIITYLREQRKRFVQGNVSAGKPTAKITASEKKGKAAIKIAGDFDLSDLGL